MNAEWRLKALRRVAPMPHDDRVAYESAAAMHEQAETLFGQGKYAQAQPLYEKALAIRRRLLGDDHRDTAQCYHDLASDLHAQEKFALGEPLSRKALDIRRRLLTDDHPDTAQSYGNVAYNLEGRGKYALAQPLFEKALEIRRRLFTDDHPATARSYDNLANNLCAREIMSWPSRCARRRSRFAAGCSPTTTRTRPRATLPWHTTLAGRADTRRPSRSSRRRLRSTAASTAMSTPTPRSATTTWLGISMARVSSPWPSRSTRRRLHLTAACLATTTPTLPLLQQPGAQSRRPGEIRRGPAPVREGIRINRRQLGDDHPYTAATYNNLATNLNAQEKYAQAQPLYEKALEINRRRFTDDHADTATFYNNLGFNLKSQGKYKLAQPLFEKALEIRRRLLSDDHPDTASSYNNLAVNLDAQGKYVEAKDQWLRAVKSLDAARLRIAFAGLDRAGTVESEHADLAAVLARLGQPAQAWQALEEDLGRGLLDELAARADRRLTPGERARLRELTAELERLDGLVDTTPQDLDQAGRAKRFEALKRERELASIALGEFQSKLVHVHGALAGQVAKLDGIQAALPADAALVTWVDIRPRGPNAADPDGEHWGVVIRAGAFRTGSRSREPVRMGFGRAPIRSLRAESGPSCEAGPVTARLTCGPQSSNYAPSASSHWPRPSAPPPLACCRPGGSSCFRPRPWRASRSRRCLPPATPGP